MLALLHFYWAAGGKWGAAAANPEKNGARAFEPGPIACIAVALLLLSAAAVLLARMGLDRNILPRFVGRLGVWALFAVFFVRAIGDFRMVGFTKRSAPGSRFARLDTLLFSPLCLALAAGCLVVALSGNERDRLASERTGDQARTQVIELLNTQAAAWNRGDFEAFCSIYADDTLFISPSGLTRGRAAVEARYRAKYPDAARRGTLTFEIIETRPVTGVEFTPPGDARPSRVHGISVVARWTLSYPGKPAAAGLTLLNLVPNGSSWSIVQDASM